MDLDLDFVRSHFPALDDGYVYLDNAGGGLVPRVVGERVADYLLSTSVQHGATYEKSAEAKARLAKARRRIAHWINAPEASEVVLGPSTTLLIQMLARAIGTTLEPGAEIIISRVDHESNMGPWEALEALGARIVIWEANRDTGLLDPDDLRSLLSDKTGLVACTHVSNILGAINPITEIAEVVHRAGALLAVDGVAFAPHRLVDVQALGIDFYVFSFYKCFGPHYATLWGKGDALRALPGQGLKFVRQDRIPEKFEPGNVNYELSWGAAGIVDYMEEIGRSVAPGAEGRDLLVAAYRAIASHEEMLAGKLLGFLKGRSSVRIIGPETADKAVRVATVSFVVEDMRSAKIVLAVDRYRIGIRFGDFHAVRLVDHLGLRDSGGVVRVSMAHYNTPAEIERLTGVFDDILPG